jgi:hypothetical protein
MRTKRIEHNTGSLPRDTPNTFATRCPGPDRHPFAFVELAVPPHRRSRARPVLPSGLGQPTRPFHTLDRRCTGVAFGEARPRPTVEECQSRRVAAQEDAVPGALAGRRLQPH